MLPFIDANVSADTKATRETFNWEPIPFEKTVIDTGKSVQAAMNQN
jgi:dihydroflavonol-4-reductase